MNFYPLPASLQVKTNCIESFQKRCHISWKPLGWLLNKQLHRTHPEIPSHNRIGKWHQLHGCLFTNRQKIEVCGFGRFLPFDKICLSLALSVVTNIYIYMCVRVHKKMYYMFLYYVLYTDIIKLVRSCHRYGLQKATWNQKRYNTYLHIPVGAPPKPPAFSTALPSCRCVLYGFISRSG